MKPDDKAESPGNGADENSDARSRMVGEGAPEPTVDTTEQRVAALEDQLRQKTREAKESYDRYVREVAEGENFKKRMQRDKTEAIRFANESLLRDLLPVVDNLEWALEHASESGDPSIVEGVRLTLKMFRDVLERNGVTEIEITSGAPFDPAIHEAVGIEPAELPPNSVLRVQQKGYRLRDRLLRAARVVVASPSGPIPSPTH